MKKKIWIKIGAPIAVALPLLTVVSCSTSWTTWQKHTGQNDDKMKFRHEKLLRTPKTFDDEELKTYYDKTNHTIKLDAINKIYQITQDGKTTDIDIEPETMFLSVLGNSLGFINVHQSFIGNLWGDEKWDEFKNYLIGSPDGVDVLKRRRGIESAKVIKFTYKNKSTSLKLNLNKKRLITRMTNALDPDAERALDISNVDEENILAETAPVAVGYGLTTSPIVMSLLSANPNMAIGLAKLVNLPIDTFKGFVSLLSKLNTFFDALTNDKVFLEWFHDMGITSSDLKNLKGRFLSIALDKH